MQFAEPSALYLWLLLPAVVWLHLYEKRRKRRRAEALGDPVLVERLALGTSRARERLKLALLLGGVFFLVLALARPQWGRGEQEVVARGVDLFLLLDTSFSMDATDVAPSRMDRARYVATELMDRLQGNRIGVIAFAGTAFVQCPLTLDYGAARIFLDTVSTGIVPEPGTNIVQAIEAALRGFTERSSQFRVIVLLTDGEEHEGDAVGAATRARDEGVVIHTVGVGTPGGEPIPLRDENGAVTDYVRDDSGQPVLSRLDEDTLGRVALTTGGGYYPVSETDSEIEALSERIGDMEGALLESRLETRYQERFYWPLGIAFALLFAEVAIAPRRRERSEASA